MASITKAIRADDTTDFPRWRSVAEQQGMSFNGWAKRALDEQEALDRALLREADDERRPD